MPQQLPNITHTILHHRRPLQAETETINPHIPRQPHRLEHFRAEHTRITNFQPALEAGVEAEDFHAGLGVRVIRGFEAQVFDSHVAEEVFEEALEAAEGEAKVGDDAFDLVEFSEVGCVDGFVAEDAVDGEVAGGAGVGGEAVEGPGGYRGGVRAEDEAEGFGGGPGVAVAYGAKGAVLVDFLDIVPVLLEVAGFGGALFALGGGEEAFRAGFHEVHGGFIGDVEAGFVGFGGIRDEEGILHVTSGMLLRDEEGIEVPEASVDVAIHC